MYSLSSNSVEMVNMTNSTLNESCINFIIRDETTTNWKNSRSNHSLPLSTAVSDLYNTMAKEAGTIPLQVESLKIRILWELPFCCIKRGCLVFES